ncbi:Ef-Hand And Coiled-Coil Domain-Containing Protein 1 [Manis pentadactyla]|nr:Ef-Hand And Coiled-Coil Domain-Containing Protein 1 [Manis pentadactyla]
MDLGKVKQRTKRCQRNVQDCFKGLNGGKSTQTFDCKYFQKEKCNGLAKNVLKINMAIACCQKAKMKNSKPKKDGERKYGSIRSLDDAAPNVVLTDIWTFSVEFSLTKSSTSTHELETAGPSAALYTIALANTEKVKKTKQDP